jgi:multidrug efflux pump subunit AcrB
MNLLFVLLMVIGAVTLLQMPVERYPIIHFGKMYINSYLPGAPPEDMETLITNEIEEAIENVEDIEFVQSTSYREHSSIVIKFKDDSDYRQRYEDIRLKVLSITKNLPPLTEPPVFNFLDVNDWFPAISVNVSGDHENTSLTAVAKELKTKLTSITGIKEVKLSGDFTQEFHLELSKDKLLTYGITFGQAVDALRQANVRIPAGHADTGEGEFIVRVDEQFRDRDDVLRVIVRTDLDGSFIRIADLATKATISYRDPFSITSVNGKDCVTLQILKDSSGNVLDIVKQVEKIVKKERSHYETNGIQLTITQDSSIKIGDSVRVLGFNLLLGIVLVCGVIWFFMGFRNAALTTIGIPFAFLVTMVFMYFTNNSINEVSLFAFVLVSGIIVDDAIVVVENIYRHVQEGKSTRQAIVTGTAEVFLPVISATLTTVVAFLPMLVMTGMVGDFFAIIPKTIAFALLASLLECLFILPCHYFEFGTKRESLKPHTSGLPSTSSRTQRNSHLQHQDNRLMAYLRIFFEKLLLLALRFPLTSLTILLVAFITSIFIFGMSVTGKSNLIRIQFFPDDYSLYYVEIFGPPGTPITTTNDIVKKLATIIAEEGETRSESSLGFSGFYISEDYAPRYGNHLGHIAVTLPSSAKMHLEDYPENNVVLHLERMREKLAPHLPKGFTMQIRPEKDGPPAGKDINIRVLGNTIENVGPLADKLKEHLQSHPEYGSWLYDLQDDRGNWNRVFRIHIKKERAAEWSLSPSDVAFLAASVLNGQIIGEMRIPDDTIDIKVKTSFSTQELFTSALDTPILDHPQGIIRLGDVCEPDFSLESDYLQRYQYQRAITLTANLKQGAPYSATMIIKDIEDLFEQIRGEHQGAFINFDGEFASTRKSFISLSYAFVIALLLIYVILAAQFHSYAQPAIIISAVIFAITGVIYGTLFSRTLFTINSFIAIIGVTGVVVNDSLVLVQFLNVCYKEGLSRKKALLKATHIRLRPILLTTLTTTLGLIPMAFGIPEYSTIWGSMAMTFVTGLCTATFLTIIIIPVLWQLLIKFKGNCSQTPRS